MKKVLISLCLFLALFGYAKDTALSDPSFNEDAIYLHPTDAYSDFTLTVSGPENIQYSVKFTGEATPTIELTDVNGILLPDGLYRYRLVAAPILDDADRSRMRLARQNGEVLADLPRGKTESGYFSILNGMFIQPETTEASYQKGDETGTLVVDADTGRDVVHLEDTIVTGSLCVGFDCVNGESFGFDTIRLKENNLRIHFEDTSNSASFPGNDWRITVNDSSNGGLSYFGIEDSSAGRVPFRIEAGASADSLYVESSGDIGMGTSNPVVSLHIVDGDSPTMRLEQDGSSGFTPQTWDVAGNEANFFVRDVTNGSKLALRIVPNTPANTLYLAGSSGYVGIGTTSPSEKLHIEGGGFRSEAASTIEGDFAALNINDTDTTFNSYMLNFTHQGNMKVRFNDTNRNEQWDMVVGSSAFYLYKIGTAGSVHALDVNYTFLKVPGELQGATAAIGAAPSTVSTHILAVDGDVHTTGDMFATAFTLTSDVNKKENIAAIEPMAVLDSVLDLPISTWKYKEDCDEIVHMGPMAQDFFSGFGLNGNDVGISIVDTAGVAMGAIQGLNTKLQMEVEVKDAEIHVLRDQLSSLEARMRALEAALLK